MTVLFNILWLICFGWTSALGFALAGILCCITVVGIPFGKMCFNFAKLCLFPFGKEIVYDKHRSVSKLGNALWIIFIGIWLALLFVLEGIAFCVTLVGIPFGIQYFKFAKLAFAPFGAKVKDK